MTLLASQTLAGLRPRKRVGCCRSAKSAHREYICCVTLGKTLKRFVPPQCNCAHLCTLVICSDSCSLFHVCTCIDSGLFILFLPLRLDGRWTFETCSYNLAFVLFGFAGAQSWTELTRSGVSISWCTICMYAIVLFLSVFLNALMRRFLVCWLSQILFLLHVGHLVTVRELCDHCMYYVVYILYMYTYVMLRMSYRKNRTVGLITKF